MWLDKEGEVEKQDVLLKNALQYPKYHQQAIELAEDLISDYIIYVHQSINMHTQHNSWKG